MDWQLGVVFIACWVCGLELYRLVATVAKAFRETREGSNDE